MTLVPRKLTNQQVFDAYVDYLLEGSGVPLLSRSIEGLLESLKHREASVDTALNVMVIAHAAQLFLEVCTPNEEPDWTENLRGQLPKLKDGLLRCRKVLNTRREDPSYATGGKGPDEAWYLLIPREYGMESWEELNSTSFFKYSGTHSLILDALLLFGARESSSKMVTLADFSENLVHDHPPDRMRAPTPWHAFVVEKAIHRHLGEARTLDANDWANAVDLCMYLLESAEPVDGIEAVWEIGDTAVGMGTSELRLPATTTEYWAWQFGRVAAMCALVDEDGFSEIAETFDPWKNGLLALSVLAPKTNQDEDLLADRCWFGALTTWSSEPAQGDEADFRDKETGESYDLHEHELVQAVKRFHPAHDHLYWFMKLGALDGTKRIASRQPSLPKTESEPQGNKQIKDLHKTLEGVERKIAALARPTRDTARESIEQSVGPKTMGILPSPSVRHLVHAWLAKEDDRYDDASVATAKAVESVFTIVVKGGLNQHSPGFNLIIPVGKYSKHVPLKGIGQVGLAAWAALLSDLKQRNSALAQALAKSFPGLNRELLGSCGPDISRAARLRGDAAHVRSQPQTYDEEREEADELWELAVGSQQAPGLIARLCTALGIGQEQAQAP